MSKNDLNRAQRWTGFLTPLPNQVNGLNCPFSPNQTSLKCLLVGLNFSLSVATNLTMSLFLQCGEWAFHLTCLRMWHKMDAYSKSGKYEPPCKWNCKKKKTNSLEVVLFDTLTLVKEERTIKISYKLQKHQGNVM